MSGEEKGSTSVWRARTHTEAPRSRISSDPDGQRRSTPFLAAREAAEVRAMSPLLWQTEGECEGGGPKLMWDYLWYRASLIPKFDRS